MSLAGEASRDGDDGPDVSLSASISKPSVARVYDYILGGHHNYAIDREFAARQMELMPDIRSAMMANRAFLGRAVRYAISQGVRQFVDIGSGLPSTGQVHEVADREAPGECRVVYIDNEPIAHAHAEILLDKDADPNRHRALCADYLDYDNLWDQVLECGVVRAAEPTCLLVVAMLHFIAPDRQPERAMGFYRDQLATDSLLVLSHGCDELDDAGIQRVVANYSSTTNAAHLRGKGEFTAFFGDFELVEPGVVWVPEWHPDNAAGFDEWNGNPARSRYLAGVARKG